MKFEKICPICEKNFKTNKSYQIFCKRTHIIKCYYCNKEKEIQSKLIFDKIKNNNNLTCRDKKCADLERKKTNLKRYGSENLFSSEYGKGKIKETNLERYGYESATKSEKVKNKIIDTNNKRYGGNSPTSSDKIKEKVKKTNIERYGFEHPLQNETIKEKTKLTNIKKYKVDNPWKSNEIKEKIKKTNIKKYGVESPSQSQYIKNKAKETNFKKYGVSNVRKSEKFQIKHGIKYNTDKDFCEKIINMSSQLNRKLTLQDIQNEINYKNPCSIRIRIDKLNLNKYLSIKDSYWELKIKDFLDFYNIKYKRHNKTQIYPLELDFFLPDYNVAIEVNDFLTHNSTYNPWGEPKDKNYHYNKTILCREKDIRLIHAWENQIKDEQKFNVLKNAILHACGLSKNKIYARDTRVETRPATSMKNFFNENNITGYRGAKTAYVLVDNKTNEDVMCYLVGYCHFGKGKYDAEIIRGASKLGYSVIGGASKLWSYIIKNTDYNSIVYYVDLNTYNGNSMNFLEGVKQISEKISFKNYFVESGELKNRNPSKHKELVELTKQGKIWTIYDAGVQTNLWLRSLEHLF